MNPSKKQQLHSAYTHEVCRKWLYNIPKAEQIVYPIFVLDKEDVYQEIKSMPGVARYGYKNIVDHLRPLVEKYNLQSVLIFGILSDDNQKDKTGTGAGTLDENQEGPTELAIKSIKKAFPKLMVIADVCLCAYTEHGHCAVLNEENQINNEASIKRLGEISVAYAKAGADMVAPSDMMDNRVDKIKEYLSEHNYPRIPVMSYAAKFASSYYGPFRDVCKSTPLNFDRQSYQLPIDSTELAIKAVERDLNEGADYILVKPLLNYLDVAAKVKERFPQAILAGYNVSGEYAMTYFSAENGGCDLKKIIYEQLRCYKRAGVDIVITYFAPKILEWFAEEQ